MSKYVADFETIVPDKTVDDFDSVEEYEKYLKEFETRVWAWGIVDIYDNSKLKIGTDLNKFMKLITLLNNPEIYFHNLGFDSGFIFDYLLKNGFTYSDSGKEKTFNAIISETNTIYKIEIIYKRYLKGIKKVTFYDSYKKLPFPVSVIGKAYDLEVSKGEIDYTRFREVGYKLSDEEIEYVKLDLLVVAQALKFQFDDGLIKMTTGSDALSLFKKSIGLKTFRSCFPILDHEVDDYIRKSYKGGFTYVAPRFKGKILGEGSVYDVNSLYPSQMRYKNLPISEPKQFYGKYERDPQYPLYIQEIVVEFEVKKDHIPTIQIKGSGWAKDTEYIEETKEPVRLYLTNVDLQLFMDHHIVHYIEYVKGYKFQETNGIFNNYIDHYMAIKENTEGAIKQNAKLLLNSLYGKFATNPDVTSKYVIMGEDGIVKYVKKDQEFRDPIYTAMGSFITAYAREVTIRTAQSVYDRFVYADTDSIHLIGSDRPDIDVHPTKLGAWDHEYYFVKAKYVRAKMYYDVAIKDNGETYNVVKGAGIPDSQRMNVSIDEYDFGFQYYKLIPKRVKGGIILFEELQEVKLPIEI